MSSPPRTIGNAGIPEAPSVYPQPDDPWKHLEKRIVSLERWIQTVLGVTLFLAMLSVILIWKVW
ncbi:MAG: hypothetical protein ACLQD9_06245 [Thermoplasmata archaeon]